MDISNKESIVWRVPEWIQAYGGLTTENVLEYFSTSPFYDRQSNNQVLKMQSQFNLLGDLNQRLSSMRGIEFIVYAEHPPDMWIIRKQRRNGPEDGRQVTLPMITVVIPLTYYFVVNENIYQSSDIYSIIASRMLSASHALRSAISAVQTLQQQQKEISTKPIQKAGLPDREEEMVQALQSTIRVIQGERTRQAEAARAVQPGQGKKNERESASPVEIKSPKARRRRSKAG